MSLMKSIGYRAVAMLYAVGFFSLLNRWVDHVQIKTTEDKTLKFPWVQKRKSRPVQILMYHGIDDAWSPFLPPTPIHQFKSHLDYLSAYCHVLTLEEAVERLKYGDVPHRAVVITIDDGYRDSYVNAFPLLKEKELPATVFLATSGIGTGHVLWHDRVCWMISHTTVPFLDGFGSRHRYELDTLEDRRVAQNGVLWYLRTLNDQSRVQAIESLSSHLEVSGNPSPDFRLMLNWEEIKEMHGGGIRFGAHTVTHPILSKTSLPAVVDEIRESKVTIERNVGDTVTTFAYPSGRPEDYNAEIKKIVEEEGFACAVSTVRGNNFQGDDLFDLQRMGYWDQESGLFGLRFEYSRFCA
ncbi:MAG: polysaccharide deacetylase family protein [Nitrospirales bacterium]